MLKDLFAWVTRIGIDPADELEVCLQKTLFVRSILFGAGPIAFGYGLNWLAAGEPLAGLALMGWAVLLVGDVVLLGMFPKRYPLWVFLGLVFILLMSFSAVLALGVFPNYLTGVLWGLLAPMGAIIYGKTGQTWRWFAAYVLLVGLAAFMPFYARTNTHLTQIEALVSSTFDIVGMSFIAFLFINYFVAQKIIFQERSENLLLNILPKEIAAILKNESRTIADHYEGASVLFADMVGFTPLSAVLAPVEMVELLNEAFSFFDSLLDKYDVEKIRTIGDSYMVASGVPRRRPDHAQGLVRMALEMRDYIATHTFLRGQRVNFRFGINSGPMIGGVIGRRKFVYDVWGDAVNVASRMESHGAGGTIQITRATYELIKEEFVCEPRGTVNVKGKGEMEVWWVVSEKEMRIESPPRFDAVKSGEAER